MSLPIDNISTRVYTKTVKTQAITGGGRQP
nr:MAG TPA: hypothetical protein [Caudoviricetes sp.]